MNFVINNIMALFTLLNSCFIPIQEDQPTERTKAVIWLLATKEKRENLNNKNYGINYNTIQDFILHNKHLLQNKHCVKKSPKKSAELCSLIYLTLCEEYRCAENYAVACEILKLGGKLNNTNEKMLFIENAIQFDTNFKGRYITKLTTNHPHLFTKKLFLDSNHTALQYAQIMNNQNATTAIKNVPLKKN